MTLINQMVSPSLSSTEISPGPMATGLVHSATVFSLARNLWGWAVFSETYGNSNNWLGLAVGHALDYAIGDNKILKIPFIPFLVGRRFFALFAQEDALEQSYQQWKDTIRNIHPIATPKHVSHVSFLTPFISQERQVRWIISSHKLYVRVQRIALSTLKLLLEVYKLVMRTMDVIDLCIFDSNKFETLSKQAVRESIVNIHICIQALNRNESRLMNRLNQIKPLIDNALQFFNLPINSDDILDKTQELFAWSKKIQFGYEFVSSTAGDAVLTLGKNLVYELTDKNAEIARLMQYDPDNNFWTNLGTTAPQKSYYSDSQELVVADTSIVSEKTDQKLSWPLYIDCQ